MAVPFPYPQEVETAMKALYLSLRENDRRRYAAVEAAKLGHGGLDYVCWILGCDPRPFGRANATLTCSSIKTPRTSLPARACAKQAADASPIATPSRVALGTALGLGGPHGWLAMQPELFWTDLTPKEIRAELAQRDLCFSENYIRDLLAQEGYRRRQMQKCLAMGHACGSRCPVREHRPVQAHLPSFRQPDREP